MSVLIYVTLKSMPPNPPPQMEEFLKFFILRISPAYEKVYRAEQVYSREGKAVIDKLLSRN
jgi:hypothetical protein